MTLNLINDGSICCMMIIMMIKMDADDDDGDSCKFVAMIVIMIMNRDLEVCGVHELLIPKMK